MARKTVIQPLMRTFFATLLGLMLLAPAAPGQALEGLKIGVVSMNTALNQSKAGERSKQFLRNTQSQKENELKAREEELQQQLQELENNIMLSEEARQERERELRQRQQDLQRRVQQAQQELQQQERRLTQTIFEQLQTVVRNISQEQDFDLVLEQNAAQVILYASTDFIDITDQVIERFNEMEAETSE